MDRRVESKLALALTDIDKDKTRRINFEQLGRVMTVLGIFRIVVYNEHYECNNIYLQVSNLYVFSRKRWQYLCRRAYF